jgi:Ser/Thr protein kinase RdoA (MazF antagonist)
MARNLYTPRGRVIGSSCLKEKLLQATELDPHALAVLEAYGLHGATLTRIDSGLINRTYTVALGGERWLLQWVNPIFGPEVHLDIEAVTAHLAAAGMLTPRLVRTQAGELWTRNGDGGVWRLMTFIEGVTYHRAERTGLCTEAGRLVGTFHRAVRSLTYAFRHRRLYVHDTPRHLAKLRDALASHRAHRAYAQVAPLAEEILERADALPSLATLPLRIVHGDLKLSNVLFSDKGTAVALVDLDTLGDMPLPVELADAWRSWCNPRGEDDASARFELGHLEAALEGYGAAASGLLSEAELTALPTAIETIALELASRFAADALLESYFGWDASRFASRSEHNRVRAESQLALARSIAEQRDAITARVRRALG